MTSITPLQRKWTFRHVLSELPFIPATSNWLKLLLSLLAEPLMFVSSLFIIAETVIPGATTWPSILTNGTKMVMSLAPEIILPGCFQQAQFARHTGNALKGKLLFCLCAKLRYNPHKCLRRRAKPAHFGCHLPVVSAKSELLNHRLFEKPLPTLHFPSTFCKLAYKLRAKIDIAICWCKFNKKTKYTI